MSNKNILLCFFLLTVEFQIFAQRDTPIQVDTIISNNDYYSHQRANEIYQFLEIGNLQEENMEIDIRILALINDGIVFSVDVKYKHKSRFYDYKNPKILYEALKPKIRELKRFNQIISLLEKAFDINLQEFEYPEGVKKTKHIKP